MRGTQEIADAGPDASAPAPVFAVRNLSKTFPGQRALADVDLDVFAGRSTDSSARTAPGNRRS